MRDFISTRKLKLDVPANGLQNKRKTKIILRAAAFRFSSYVAKEIVRTIWVQGKVIIIMFYKSQNKNSKATLRLI